MEGPLGKHKLEGIGAASASAVLAALLSNPGTAFLAGGISGKILSFLLTKIFSGLASFGLVVLNVGAARLDTVVDGNNWDGTWDTAEKAIQDAKNSGRDLTPEQIKMIDDPVIAAFRKWVSFARKK